jgi:hypothetical protein
MTALLNPFWYGAGADPYFANVVLLLHCDGTNGAATLTDNSSAHRSVTCSGNHKLTTAQFKFGTASLDCTTIGAGAASAADSADWLFGAGQFTVECFVRPTLALSGVIGLVTQFGGSSNLGWFFGFNGNTLNFFYSTTGSNTPVVTGAYTPTLSQWAHVAVDRDASNVLRIYADGVVVASSTVAVTFFDSTRTMKIGNDENASRAFTGQIDEVRITKGVARYGGAFTPPSAPFPDS